MSNFYFYAFVALIIVALAPVVRKPARIFEYPQFMATVFAVFILPQAVSLTRFPGTTPAGAIETVLLMCVLCLGMCLAGYLVRPSKSALPYLTLPVNAPRLFIGGLVFVACGYFFDHLISLMTEEETGGSMWSGVVTIYAFFEGLIYPGFAICLITALQNPRQPFPWIATAIAAYLPIEITIFAGRREATTQFVLTIFLTIFYTRRWVPPRLVIVAGIVFATLAIPATGTYRTIVSLGAWNYLPQFDLVENFTTFVNSESSTLELRNGAMLIESTRRGGSYEYGSAYWDQMVFRFMPAQIIGARAKQALMFHTLEERTAEEEMAQHLGFQVDTGSTMTGMGDVFRQFGFAGCVFFALVAVLFRNLYSASLKPGSTFAQLLYISIATTSMRAITHQTVDFLPGLTYNAVFLGLLTLFAHEGRRRRPVIQRHSHTYQPLLRVDNPRPDPPT